MQDKKTSTTTEDQDFFDKPKNIQWILRIFYGICVLLVVLDFVIHRHIETAIEKIPAFYAVYGFVACVILVLIATQMRKLLMRDEDYFLKNKGSETDGSKINHSEKEGGDQQ